jgi:hypothetical protein
MSWKPHYYFQDFRSILPYLDYSLAPDYSHLPTTGAAFIILYQPLASTGEGMAAELADRFGIDIRTKDFGNKA